MTSRFRFGVILVPGPGRQEWWQSCRTAERLGYDVIAVPDHLGVQAPFPAMVSAAAATERVRLTTYVLNSAFWNPTLLAREILSTDLLTDGRVEVGLGTGYVRAEFDKARVEWGTAGSRVRRLEEAIVSLLGHLADPRGLGFTHAPPQLPLLVGGNGDRVLRLAAAHADIVSFAGAVLAPGSSRGTLRLIDGDAMAERVRYFENVAGDRAARPERNILVQSVVVTADRRGTTEALRRRMPYLTAEQVADVPTLLIGTSKEIATMLLERRERYGFSYVCVQERDMTAFAPVIELLAGE
ncbi:TIGR03621 family F420-dependent LLM class oxidoreductase [Streptantibioticus cattleyicolor]|uniref:Rif11-like protein n=1 Tax=Streptantibioticus cattleyicolor (strain ATCC 35852 / DSM 46488 / JCM 4925 / NBRC 14057 / NRRL 8057) TaxID=1003195 RepID=F8JJP9_STREN|nr:TIGR03621 family F420-dependent LLM class oxidoreductase [Streptantibioticus cattleyicolor]AEW99904.1 Rif11-like protein [Streptantibioticus cattleyicolor NRRL 8057 = DSM 46488]CCB71063.1 putative Rif11 homolog [Streptantibioticus cattleyicolor NRRL 8057 = DSM 46488]